MRIVSIIGLLLLGACTPLSEPRVEPSSIPITAASPRADPLSSLSTAMDREAASRGRAMALVGCASCHAIDTEGDSPLAIGPPFREIVQRRSSDDLAAAFEQGLVTAHPTMPLNVFRANEIHDLTAHLNTLRDGAAR